MLTPIVVILLDRLGLFCAIPFITLLLIVGMVVVPVALICRYCYVRFILNPPQNLF